jgi:hypothetical protein
MMNPFLLDPHERLRDWKAFRTGLSMLSEPDQLRAVAGYWALAPMKSLAYDVERPLDLPTPWEMIDLGDWCRNSVAYGMEFTLRLAGWDASRLKLVSLRR